MAFEYQNFASLGVNLNRQKYGPLDISTVFTSQADLDYYLSKGAKKTGVSAYWLDIVPYPYSGQIVALTADGVVSVFVLSEKADGTFETKSIAGSQLSTDEKSISKADDGVLTLLGFSNAASGQQPRKNAAGELEWYTPDTSTVTGLSETVGQHTSQIAALESKVSGAFRFKGSKATKAELDALTGMQAGDVWQVGDKEYAYNGTAWVELGFNIDVSGKVDKVEGKGLSSNDFTDTLKNKLDGIAAGAQVNAIDSADTAEFTISEDKKLSVKAISKDKITGLNTALSGKVDKVEGSRLITSDEAAKLTNIPQDAAENIIEAIQAGGTALTITDKTVNIPIATAGGSGLVKSSEDTDKVAVSSDGTMIVNSVSVSKIVQGEDDVLILDGGMSEA